MFYPVIQKNQRSKDSHLIHEADFDLEEFPKKSFGTRVRYNFVKMYQKSRKQIIFNPHVICKIVNECREMVEEVGNN